MRALLWILLLLGTPVFAKPVKVSSGDHDGFTRLVLDFGQPVNWSMGRGTDGYQFKLEGPAPIFDVSSVFDIIGTSRLAAIWAAPDTGILNIGLACACHAIPFEFRPGIIVIDLKEGPPPKGSSFEMALDGSAVSPLKSPSNVRPLRRPERLTKMAKSDPPAMQNYDWTADAYVQIKGGEPPSAAVLNPSPELPEGLQDPVLQPLRDDIINQMARGAAQGVVEMTLPQNQEISKSQGNFPSAQINIGGEPFRVTKADQSLNTSLGAKGVACIDDSSLDFASWGDEATPIIEQLVAHRSKLNGEFDKPNQEAVSAAVRFQLFLGFGAEARQMALAFDAPPEDAKLWSALGRLLDGEPEDGAMFAGQAACEGPAALWAVLADATLVPGDLVNSAAVRLAFGALPLHLRRQLGPLLIERFLQIQDEEAARALRDGLDRALGAPDPAIALAASALDMQNGDPAEAEKRVTNLLEDPGQASLEALITQTEARSAQNLPISAETARALEASLGEQEGSALEPRLQNALTLAEAGSGNFLAAFSRLERYPDPEQQVWQMLTNLADDASFLNFAIIDGAAPLPSLDEATIATTARRLAGLGLGKAAQQWINAAKSPDPLLIAEISLLRKDAASALAALADQEGDFSDALRLRALELLGEEAERAKILRKAGEDAGAQVAFARARDWTTLQSETKGPWAAVAKRLSDTPKAAQTPDGLPSGTLFRGSELSAAGADTRAAIEALLAETPTPSLGTPQTETTQPAVTN